MDSGVYDGGWNNVNGCLRDAMDRNFDLRARISATTLPPHEPPVSLVRMGAKQWIQGGKCRNNKVTEWRP